MTVQPVRLFGDPVLRTPATPVTDFDRELRTLVADLHETMREQGGAGLAAPQIGVGMRVFVFHADGFSGHLVNSEWNALDDTEQIGPEGCLSIPGLRADCRRANHVVARGRSMHGEPIAIEGTTLLARAVQHESDHLDGVLFVDRLDTDARKQFLAEVRAAPWFDPANPPTVKTSPHPFYGAGANPRVGRSSGPAQPPIGSSSLGSTGR